MSNITREQYEFALARVEELLPMIDENTPANDKKSVELSVVSDIVIAYEKEHYPIEKPTVAELIEFSLNEKGMTQKQLAGEIGVSCFWVIPFSFKEKGMTQKQLAGEIGVSPSRVNDYISGRSEPTLRIARLLCRVLNISPEAMLGY